MILRGGKILLSFEVKHEMRCSALLLGLLIWGHVNVESDAQFPNNMVNYQYPAAAAPAWSPPMQYPQVPQQRQQYPPRQQQQYPQQQRWFYGPPQQTWLGRLVNG